MRVAILMSDTGGGHRRLSQAIATALADLTGAQVRPAIVDLFATSQPTLFDRLTRLYSPVIRRAPWLYGLAFHLTDHALLYRLVVRSAWPRLVPRATALLASLQPDVVVIAHPLCSPFALAARAALGRRLPFIATVTELVTVHRSWIEPAIDRYTAATPEVQARLIAGGIPPERIVLTGLPVGPRFGAITTPPAALRLRWGLDPDRPTVLLLGGGEGAGRLEPLARGIAALDRRLQLLIVCGRNERLRQRLAGLDWPVPARVLGFTDEMPELMHLSDIIVTKGGPQTIVEALASGRPLIITHTLPGQEEGNAEWVERNGVGFAGTTPQRCLAALRRLLDQPALRAEMAARARALSRPEAATTIARLILATADLSDAPRDR